MNILKCEFHVQEIKFLRLLISIEGLRINPSKVDAVIDWRTSINLKKTQFFVDFCNFYRRFIKDFSKIVKSLVRLTRKDVIFKWSTAYQQAFNQLKIIVIQAPALRHFDRFKEIILEIDSFDYVNDGILS